MLLHIDKQNAILMHVCNMPLNWVKKLLAVRALCECVLTENGICWNDCIWSTILARNLSPMNASAIFNLNLITRFPFVLAPYHAELRDRKKKKKNKSSKFTIGTATTHNCTKTDTHTRSRSSSKKNNCNANGKNVSWQKNLKYEIIHIG